MIENKSVMLDYKSKGEKACPYCNMKFDLKNRNLSRHIKDIHEVASVQCDKCQRYLKRRHLDKHTLENCRADRNLFPIVCNRDCGWATNTYRKMKQHIRKKHVKKQLDTKPIF